MSRDRPSPSTADGRPSEGEEAGRKVSFIHRSGCVPGFSLQGHSALPPDSMPGPLSMSLLPELGSIRKWVVYIIYILVLPICGAGWPGELIKAYQGKSRLAG